MSNKSAFQEIIGQEHAVSLLTAALAQPGHAYLLVGPPNVGKTLAAGTWVKCLFCSELRACGSCIACRTLEHGNHPDFHCWQPANKQTTSIEQIREIIRQAELAPYQARYQVHLLWADTFSVAAANSLLKILEEPPSRTIFLLLAQGITGILPTIVSRCQRIPFGLLGENTIAKWLVERHALTTECARDAARRSAGRIGRALALAQGAELPTSGILAKIDLLEALAEAEKIASLDSNEQNLLLEELIGQVRDVMILSRTGKADWIGQTELVQQLAQTRRSFGTWERIASKLESSRQRLLAGANAKLLWTVLAGYLTSTLANTD